MVNTGILIVGVGGQGSLLSGRILGKVAFQSGLDVKVSEVHGMSQRGGSVVTHVRFGKKIYSPLVGTGQADYILAFEKLEALRWAGFLKKGGTIIANDQEIPPTPVTLGYQGYPKDIKRQLEKIAATFIIDAAKIAIECGSLKAVNMVLLGALASKLDFKKDLWIDVIEGTVPPETIDLNVKAFKRGLEIIVH